ncbi:MAG: esterase-like activity of phytase family protein, partial [Planctomycetia bacterium]|nr:esterase-like activity of phytase family protein [Planctomycetia bacterium]
MARIVGFLPLGAALLAAAALPAAAPRIEVRGTIELPASVTDAAGHEVPVSGLSGVTWFAADRYAAVMDNSDLVVRFRLALAADGAPLGVSDVDVVRLRETHDYEDIAPWPAPSSNGGRMPDGQGAQRVLVCEEDTPAIRGAWLDDGELGEPLPLPDILRSRRLNRGLEALAVDPDGRHLWTATEESLPEDGPAATADAGTVVRIARIPLPNGDDLGAAAQFAYAVDPPHRFARMFGGTPLSGLVALAALGGGRLLVLERSGAPGLPPFAGRINLVDTTGGADVSAIERGLAAETACHVTKSRLWEDSLGVNLEGLCLGPRLASGDRAVVAVADNGGIGGPNRVVCFTITEAGAGPTLPALAALAALVAGGLVAVGLFLGRFAS